MQSCPTLFPAAISERSEDVGFAFLLLDENGGSLASGTGYRRRTPQLAGKYLALIQGLRAACATGVDYLTVATDSQTLIDQVEGRSRPYAVIRTLLGQVDNLLEIAPPIGFQLVQWRDNRARALAAHAFASGPQDTNRLRRDVAGSGGRA